VLLGQKIADSDAYVSAPVHSSVSGVVKEIKRTLTPSGLYCDAVFIENDGENRAAEFTRRSLDDIKKMPRQELVAIAREAGIVGMGGAGFPTHVKLSPPPGDKISAVIINAAECEPYLTSDHRVLLEETERLIDGIRVLLTLFPEARAIIGIESNKTDAVNKLNALLSEIKEDRISLAVLVPKYPQGSEKQLISAILRREVPSGGLPSQAGVVVLNADTTIALQRAVLRGRPLIRRIVTVDGSRAPKLGNYKVRLGMTYRDFVEHMGGFKQAPAKIISGGPMMGVCLFNLDAPIIKTSSAFLCFGEGEVKIHSERPCIRCGRCVERCPLGLMPLELNAAATAKETREFIQNNGMDCMECGSCSYVCPSKRHLAQSIRTIKRAVMAERRKKADAPAREVAKT
jgi:electron transport complex protein RnfC